MNIFQKLSTRFSSLFAANPLPSLIEPIAFEPAGQPIIDASIDQGVVDIQVPRRSGSEKRVTTAYSQRDEVIGVVSGFAACGIFIRLPNDEVGLVCTDEICWPGQDAPTYLMEDKVSVVVIGFKERHGLYLSIKQVGVENLFANFAKVNGVDSQIKGVVKSIRDYGVFVSIGPGVTGLLHVSQIKDISVYSQGAIGQSLDVQIDSIDENRMRINLRLA